MPAADLPTTPSASKRAPLPHRHRQSQEKKINILRKRVNVLRKESTKSVGEVNFFQGKTNRLRVKVKN